MYSQNLWFPFCHRTGKGKGKGGRGEKKAVSKSSKAGLTFPVGRVGRFLKSGKYAR
jgi:histone H2A